MELVFQCRNVFPSVLQTQLKRKKNPTNTIINTKSNNLLSSSKRRMEKGKRSSDSLLLQYNYQQQWNISQHGDLTYFAQFAFCSLTLTMTNDSCGKNSLKGKTNTKKNEQL